jgi:hypothetical protein
MKSKKLYLSLTCYCKKFPFIRRDWFQRSKIQQHWQSANELGFDNARAVRWNALICPDQIH